MIELSTVRRLTLASALVLGAANVVAASLQPSYDGVRRKYIWFGWDTQNLSAEQVLDNAAAFDASVYDGIPVNVVVKDPQTGKSLSVHAIFDNPEITDEMLAPHVPVLKEIVAHRGLRESFISSFYTPKKRVAWTDDEMWAKAARTMAALARAAKAAGVRGLFMDQEEYHPPKQFEWQVGDPTFADCARLARQRGREVFAQAFRDYPEMAVFSCYGMLSADATFDYFGSPDPFDATRQKRDLWPHFFNGMLDAAPFSARLIDGTEMAYEYEQGREEYAKSAACVKVRGRSVVAPENRAKYGAVAQASFGFFMDGYVKTNKTARYWYDALNGSRLGHFDHNLWGATHWSDEYVWLYAASQRMTGIHWRNKNGNFNGWTTPNDRLPGYDQVALANKDPLAWFTLRVGELKAQGKLVNLCTKPMDEILAPNKDRPGMRFGIIEFPEAKAGDWYGFRFRARGEVQSIVRWGETGLRARPLGASILPVCTPMGEPDAEGWRAAVGVVRIPNDVQRPVLVLKTFAENGQTSSISEFALYRLLSHQDR